MARDFHTCSIQNSRISDRSILCQLEQGFTLLELMVVIVIMGILSAIALPSVINHSHKAKEAEARLYISAVNKDQQRYYMEHIDFSPNLSALGLGIPAVTQNYTYVTAIATDPGNGEKVALSTATQAVQVSNQLRAFSGQVWVKLLSNNLLTISVACESAVGQTPPIISNHQCP